MASLIAKKKGDKLYYYVVESARVNGRLFTEYERSSMAGVTRYRSERLRFTDSSPVLHTRLTPVETAEPELLEELQADRRIGPLLVARLSDRVAVVAPGQARQAQRWLLKAGHKPRIIGGME
jgi:hypothetical protein